MAQNNYSHQTELNRIHTETNSFCFTPFEYFFVHEKHEKHERVLFFSCLSCFSWTINNQNYGFQNRQGLLIQLKLFLEQLQERLESVSNSYGNKIEVLHNEGGLMDETYRDFVQEQFEPTRDLINRLMEHIECNDLPAVEKAIRDIEPFL